jgi:hypothetical protein
MNNPKEKTYILKFSGDKTELHTQLKVWCAEAEKTINGTILELIKNHLEETKSN